MINVLYRAWVGEEVLPEQTFKYVNIPASKNSNGSSAAWIAIILVIIIGMVVFYIIKTKKIKLPQLLQNSNEKNIIPMNINYNTFIKNSNLQDRLENVIKNETETLKEEFKNIGIVVEEKIYPSVTYNIARVNNDRNRYKDMVPYDDNIATLNTKTGEKRIPSAT